MDETIRRWSTPSVYVWILLILFSFLAIMIFSCYRLSVLEQTKSLEKAYFEGQKDALEGDIRIARDSTSKWVWVRSPWDDEKNPIYIPQ